MIQFAGPMDSQYLGFGTLDTRMNDFGCIGISAHTSIGPSMCGHGDDLGPVGGPWVVNLRSPWGDFGIPKINWVAKGATGMVQGQFWVDFGLKVTSLSILRGRRQTD